MTALTEAPDLYEVPADPDERDRFRIQHEGQAVWAVRKLRDAAAHRRRIEQTAEAEMARIQAWVSRECAEADREDTYFTGLLTDYVMRVREASAGHVKSVDTPYGSVKTRQVPAGWEMDEDAVLAWAEAERPELVRTSQRFALADAKKLLSVVGGVAVDPETGALVPGITVTPGCVRASISLDLGGAL